VTRRAELDPRLRWLITGRLLRRSLRLKTGGVMGALNFPADLLKNLSLNPAHAGATVNGEPSIRLSSLLPANADEVY
jgi:hypothetical protein